MKKKLGPLVTTYCDRPLRWRDLVVMFIPATLAVLSPLCYGLWRSLYARTFYGPAAARVWSWPWYSLSTVALIPLLLLALRRVRRAHRIVKVYKNGLAIKGKNRVYRILSWETIGGIADIKIQNRFLGMPMGVRYRATLFLVNGNPIKLDPQLPNLEELCARIKGKIYPRLLLELRSSLQSGASIHFGSISMNDLGIDIRREKIPWEEIAIVKVRKGYLMIELANQRSLRIPVGTIPNIEIFIQLVQEGVGT